jgi:periplasmic protein TonB
MAAYVHDSQFMTRRGAVLAAIIALHVFIAWALATGLARRAIEVMAPPIQTQIVQEVKPKDLPPPPPPPKFERPPVEVPPPEVNINLPVESNTTAISNVTTRHVEAAAPPRAVKVVRGGPDIKHFPNSDEYYPPASRRLEEQGTAIVHVCVDPNGRITGEPTVERSSGSSRLDEGAIRLAKSPGAHYFPNTEDGKPIPSCFAFGIKFQMR